MWRWERPGGIRAPKVPAEADLLRVQVLGEVRAWREGDPIALGPASRRAVLGLLALSGGQPLSRLELVAGMWNGRPPRSAVNVLQTHVKHLRRLLEPGRAAGRDGNVLRRVGDGYALDIPGCAVDLLEFRADLAAAAIHRREGRLDEAAKALELALSRWQGPPLADVPALARHPKLIALAEERQSALGRYAEVMIAAGRAADVIAVLEEEAAARPLDEAAHARLMLAYHGAGRRDQAFATYHATRRRLADDLGVDPGSDLVAVYAELLHDAPPAVTAQVVTTGGVPVVTEAPAATIPAQLIADLPVFVGRSAELSLLDSAVSSRVVVLSGPAGMGKTSLAVHWAHRASRQFPDGQLYVNLRGFHPAGAAMDPMDALWAFLDALGVPPEQIPADLDARSALYRSKLASKRVLVVLDNAVNAAQVRPLLPGGGACLAVVTSRNRLAGLVAAEGARLISLNPLSTSEARGLLVHRIGADRAATEPEAVLEIVHRCAGLPLALAIVVARAAIEDGQPLQTYADELRPSGERLSALTAGDSSTDLREVFSWSYHALRELPAWLFRLLGLHPGQDISAAAAASLAGQPLPEIRAALTELVSASLVVIGVPGRYSLHDLVREYAAELAQQSDPPARRRAAGRRIVAHYLHTGYAADRLLNPERDPIELSALPPGVTPEPMADSLQAIAWFSAEHAVLLAVFDHAVAAGWNEQTWQLAWTMWTFLDRQGHWLELVSTQQAAIAAAGRAVSCGAQADAHRLLARAYTRLSRIEDARTQLLDALELYERIGNRTGQANVHLNMTLVYERQDDYAKALEHARTSFVFFAMDGDRAGQTRARSSVGWYHALLGDHARALVNCRAALAEMQALGDRRGQAPIWDSLGYSHHKLGHHARAVACFKQAVEIYSTVGDRHVEGMVLAHLAEAQQAWGKKRQARAVWRRAVAILAELDPPAAQRLRDTLVSLAQGRSAASTEHGLAAPPNGRRRQVAVSEVVL
jgi:DNA-binding SARP family transcriptional activator